MKLLEIVSVGFDVTDQLQKRFFFCIHQILEKKCSYSILAIHRLQESLSFSKEGGIVKYSH
jgi:hypothetical protein